MKFPTCWQLHSQWFFCFQEQFLHSIHTFQVILVKVCPEHLASLAEIIPILNIESHSKTYFLLIVPSAKLQSKVLRVSVVLFPSLKQNLMHSCCFTKVAIFQIYENHKWNHTHSYLKDNTQQSQLLQPHSFKQEMAQRALFATSATSLGQEQQCNLAYSLETIRMHHIHRRCSVPQSTFMLISNFTLIFGFK